MICGTLIPPCNGNLTKLLKLARLDEGRRVHITLARMIFGTLIYRCNIDLIKLLKSEGATSAHLVEGVGGSNFYLGNAPLNPDFLYGLP